MEGTLKSNYRFDVRYDFNIEGDKFTLSQDVDHSCSGNENNNEDKVVLDLAQIEQLSPILIQILLLNKSL